MSSTKTPSIKKTVAIMIGLSFLVATLFAMLAVSLNNSEHSMVERDLSQTTDAPGIALELPLPQDLTGTWRADSSNGAIMTAIVQNNTIEILLENEGSSMTYWFGTFPGVAENGSSVISNKIEVSKIVLSGATSKNFLIKDISMSFEFKAAGMTKNVELIRV
jgi:hypothetical protein